MQVADFVLDQAAQLLTDSATKALLASEVVRHLSVSEMHEGDLETLRSGARRRFSTSTKDATSEGNGVAAGGDALEATGEGLSDGPASPVRSSHAEFAAARCSQAYSSTGDISPVALRERRISKGPLPEWAHAFVGVWKPLSSANYGAFLQEVAGLNWAVRRIAERMPLPAPTVRLINGQLHCETLCVGAKPVHEILEPGESIFFEPNMNCEYKVVARWEGDAFVATRSSDRINSGRPTEQRRWVDPDRDVLVIRQSWGGSKDFVAEFARA